MPDPIEQIEKEIRRIVRHALARGQSAEQIDTLVRQALQSSSRLLALDAELQADLIRQAKEIVDWIGERTLTPLQRQAQTDIIRNAGAQYAKTKQGLHVRVLRAVDTGLRNGEASSQIEGRLRQVLRGDRTRSETITQTALGAFDRARETILAREAGASRLRYSGPPPERDFCSRHYGKIYTVEDISTMSNGHGLSVMYYCGGWRCRHFWEPVFN